MLARSCKHAARCSSQAHRIYFSTAIEPATENKTKTGVENTPHPKLNPIPTLPVLGHMLHQYSGTPPLNINDAYNYQIELRNRFGEFYSCGIPGFGSGMHGTIYVTIDPDEMLKVVRNEGAYPGGAVERLWTFRKAFKDNKSALVEGDDYGIFGRGERWKTQRTFLQTGMLDPKAANGFMPGILRAAGQAADAAPAHRENLNRFLNFAAFDMFCSFMFGELTGTAAAAAAKKNNALQEENFTFCKSVINAMGIGSDLIRSPFETFMNRELGISTPQYKEFKANWDTAWKIGKGKLRAFLERYEKDELDDVERASYFANAIRRREEDPVLTKEEMLEVCMMSLLAAVDTTSTVTAWNLVNISMNPEVQGKLYQELSKGVEETGGGQINASTLSKSNAPYLHAVIRETYRMTPPFANAMIKSNSKGEIDVHGVTLPKDSVLMLDNIGNDTAYVTDAKDFRPERWLPDQVKARKGTVDERLDHPVLRDFFSQGARRCPGSRVASNEILAMVAQLVLKYEMKSPLKEFDEVQHKARPFVQPSIPPLDFVARN